MDLKYLTGALLSFPLLPLLYYQGRRVRARVPRLPEAKGPEGMHLFRPDTGRTLRLLTIGESTIAGVGVETHREGFTGTLAGELSRLFEVNVAWKVYARSGYTARTVCEKLVPRIEEDHADLIVVGLGGNDAFILNTPRRWRRQVDQLIAALRRKFPEASIVFCNMPPIKEFPAFTPLIHFVVGNLVEILGRELDRLVQKHSNVFYQSEIITLKAWTRRLGLETDRSIYFSDGVHPSKLTYQTWARDLAQGIWREKWLRLC